MKKNIIISYDIPNDRRRTKLAKKLVDYIDRIQYSVFAGELSESQLQEITAIVAKIIDNEQDSVIIIEVCANCLKKLKEMGTAKTYVEDGPVII